ncbi:larval cuticle protein 16/17-like [Dendroctonus ponderosae]|uniref:Uncharacterized protein n=1 Tax=Dendroctonus ponderosae TaxID=77166 RepID=A0AAR5Q361_DENPD|nr:larval cuticle protein 16/17-like [Dendroctonus ponderosae]XP_048522773.1 larval cuticle protein 16/17-like [Dendroctonus ponderosae]KAH1001918.1 hypothetical protein HUJ04_005874 [Dendroctonus ponderosae]KAH1017786.1 hypothetical protein HUJ05_008383 [Dendroctonus ponderosae]KAH1017806.1 hypothetical protein HUJ05_008401 [Dendroctonus ponderosae]
MFKVILVFASVAFACGLPVASDLGEVPLPISTENAPLVEPATNISIGKDPLSTASVAGPISSEGPKKITTYPAPVPILDQKSDGKADGTYNWSFESGDGTKAEQAAEVKTVKVSGEAEDTKVAVEDVKGSYSYVDPEGKTHSRQYVANEYGFFIKGDDIFPEIASHLAYIETHPQPISAVGRKTQ